MNNVKQVIIKLEELGYTKPSHDIFGFMFGFKNPLDYNKAYIEHRQDGEGFVVKTVSSHWSVDEATEFMLQLHRAIEHATILNNIYFNK